MFHLLSVSAFANDVVSHRTEVYVTIIIEDFFVYWLIFNLSLDEVLNLKFFFNHLINELYFVTRKYDWFFRLDFLLWSGDQFILTSYFVNCKELRFTLALFGRNLPCDLVLIWDKRRKFRHFLGHKHNLRVNLVVLYKVFERRLS